MFLLILETKGKVDRLQRDDFLALNSSGTNGAADTLLKDLLGTDNSQNSADYSNEDLKTVYDCLHNPLKHIELTDEQKRNFDINKDSKINDRDFLDMYNVIGQKEFDTVKLNPNLEGDFNGDGNIGKTDSSLLTVLINVKLGLIDGKTLTDKLAHAADINHDGILNRADVDALLEKVQSPKLKDLSTEPSRPLDSELLVGDVDKDGKISYRDVERLGRALNSSKKEDKLTELSLEAIDINQNGQADFGDLSALEKLAREAALKSLKGESSIRGDLNNDNQVNDNDLDAMSISKKYFFYSGAIDEKIAAADLGGGVNGEPDGKIDEKDFNILRFDLLKQPGKLELKDFQNLSPNPNGTFISQSPGAYNTSEDTVLLNGNCGPAAFASAVQGLGINLGGGPESASKKIELMRQLMGANPSTYIGVADDDFISGANALGLTAKNIHGTADDIRKALEKGYAVIASVDPSAYSASPQGAHAVHIKSVDANGNFTIENPAFSKPMLLTAKELELAMKRLGGDMVIIGKTSLDDIAQNSTDEQTPAPNSSSDTETVKLPTNKTPDSQA